MNLQAKSLFPSFQAHNAAQATLHLYPVCMKRAGILLLKGIQAILEEVAKTDPRAKTIRPQDLIDRRFLDEMTKSGSFDKLWASK